MGTTRDGSAGNGAEDSMVGRTQGFDARTVTASGKPTGVRRPTIDEFRRSQADKAIALIEDLPEGYGHPRRSLARSPALLHV